MAPLYDEETGEPLYKLSVLEDRVIDNIVDYTCGHGKEALLPNDTKALARLADLAPAVVKGVLSGLVHKRILQKNTNFESMDELEFTPDGAEYAYTLVNLKIIPAADRFVPINHNSQEVAEAKSTLEKLENRIRTSNELTASQSERLAMISEVQGVRQLLDQPAVRVASIWAATKNSGILEWLATHTADAAVTALATEVVGHLFKICGLS